jgi:hypothetical protein
VTRAHHVRRRGTFEDLGSAIASLEQSGDVAVVLRGRPRWLVVRCPDGCGENVPINLDQRSGPAWHLYDGETLTVYPSIWRESGCESHFVIWRNRIWWGIEWDAEDSTPEVEQKVLARLGEMTAPVDAFVLSSEIGEEPWITWQACQTLFKRRVLMRHGERGRFRFSLKR